MKFAIPSISICASCFALFLGGISPVIAQSVWQDPGDLWSDPLSWSPAGVPAQGSDLEFGTTLNDANLNNNRVRMTGNQAHNEISLTATLPFQIVSQDAGNSTIGIVQRTLSASVIESSLGSSGFAYFVDFSTSDAAFRSLRLTAGVVNMNSGFLVLGRDVQGISGGAEFGSLNFTGVASAMLRGDFRSTNNQNGVLDLGAVSMAVPGVGEEFTIEVLGSASGANELTIESLSGGGTGAFIQNNVTATGAGHIVLTPTGDTSFAGVIRDNNTSHSLAVTVNGSGRQVLTGANTYTGATTVSAGTLLINGSTGDSAVTVAAGATLGGSGTIGGTVNVSGNLNPGTSPGDLTFEDSLTLNSTATLNLEITGIGVGEFDRLIGDGANTFTFDGTLALDNTGYSATLGDTITVFSNWGGFAGSFDAITGTDLGGGLSWDTSNLGVDGSMAVIPEPSTWALIAVSLAAFMAFRRRARC